jgi:DNA-binding NtrC family response regulator
MAFTRNLSALGARSTVGEGAGEARILVTDDRPEMLRAIKLALRDRYRCEFAGSVAAARRQLRAERFDVALCDVHAAGEPAMALAEEIRREHPRTAVILVTGEDDPKVADRAFAHGVHGYLIEPLQPGQLLITVINALRWRELEIGKTAHARNLQEQFDRPHRLRSDGPRGRRRSARRRS